MLNNRHKIILFDGICNLCNSAVAFIIRYDKNSVFKFAPLQSDAAEDILKELNCDYKDTDSIIYIEKGECYIKSTAALKISKHLDGFWRYFYSLIFIPSIIRDFIYDIIAKSRYRIFGKRNKCMIPDENVIDRFL